MRRCGSARTQFATRGILMSTEHVSEAEFPKLLRASEAAELLRISVRKLWALEASGAVQSVRIGRSVAFDMADLIAFIQKSKRKR